MLFIIAHNFGDFNMEIIWKGWILGKLNISQVMWLLQIPKFYHQQHASAWMDTQWCIKSQNTGLKHQCIHNSCFLVKHLEFVRVI